MFGVIDDLEIDLVSGGDCLRERVLGKGARAQQGQRREKEKLEFIHSVPNQCQWVAICKDRIFLWIHPVNYPIAPPRMRMNQLRMRRKMDHFWTSPGLISTQCSWRSERKISAYLRQIRSS